jgi:hypothetical protein
MCFRPNRNASAWSIFVPIIGAFLAIPLLIAFIPDTNSEVEAMLTAVFRSLALGIAAVWLLAPWLEHRLRILAFLKMTPACAGFAVFSLLVGGQGMEPAETAAASIFLVVIVALTILGLTLTGRITRARYRPLLLLACSTALITGVLLAIALPIFLAETGGGVGWGQFLVPVLAVAGGCVIALLPFMLLAFANGFYRDRLKNLLRLEPAEALASAPPEPPTPVSESIERTSV